MKKISLSTFLHTLRSKLLFLGVLAITIFLAVLSYRLLSIYLTTYPEKINNVSVTEGAHASEWELFTNEQGEVKPLSTDNGYSFTSLDFEGQTYYMSRVITETYEDAMIRIGAVTSQISVFLDGKLLYTDNGDGDNRIGYVTLGAVPEDRTTGISLPLPSDALGKTITIAACQPFAEGSGDLLTIYPCEVTIYSQEASQAQDISYATKLAYSSILLAVLGFFLLVLFLYQTYHREADWGLFFLSLFALIWMADFIFSSTNFNKYFSIELANYEPFLEIGSLSFLLLFLLTRMKRCKKIFLPFVLLQLLSLPSMYLTRYSAITLDYRLYTVFLKLPEYSALAGIFAAFILMIWELKKGNRFYSMMRYFVCAALVLLPAGIALYGFLHYGSPYGIKLIAHQILENFRTGLYGSYRILMLLRYFLVFSCFIISFCEFIYDAVHRFAALEILHMKNKLAQESYDQLNQYTEQVMILRHDEKKHFTLLGTLLEEKDYDKALAYTQEVIRDVENITPIVNTQNYLINTILNSKLASAERYGIRLNIRHASAPEKLNVSDKELCSLLMNVLDNAIFASQELEEKDRYITLDLYTKNHFLCIFCENGTSASTSSHAEDKNTEGIKSHGYGLIIIEKVVEKYKGVLDIKQEDHTFKVHIALPI